MSMSIRLSGRVQMTIQDILLAGEGIGHLLWVLLWIDHPTFVL